MICECDCVCNEPVAKIPYRLDTWAGYCKVCTTYHQPKER